MRFNMISSSCLCKHFNLYSLSSSIYFRIYMRSDIKKEATSPFEGNLFSSKRTSSLQYIGAKSLFIIWIAIYASGMLASISTVSHKSYTMPLCISPRGKMQGILCFAVLSRSLFIALASYLAINSMIDFPCFPQLL